MDEITCANCDNLQAKVTELEGEVKRLTNERNHFKACWQARLNAMEGMEPYGYYWRKKWVWGFSRAADFQAVDVDQHIALYAAPSAAPKDNIIGTKTWFEGGKLVTQNLTESEVYKQAAPESAGKVCTQATTVDCIGLALDLEKRAKTVESQTTERAMLAAARGLRLIAAHKALKANETLALSADKFEHQLNDVVMWFARWEQVIPLDAKEEFPKELYSLNTGVAPNSEGKVGALQWCDQCGEGMVAGLPCRAKLKPNDCKFAAAQEQKHD